MKRGKIALAVTVGAAGLISAGILSATATLSPELSAGRHSQAIPTAIRRDSRASYPLPFGDDTVAPMWHLPMPHTDVCRVDAYTWRVFDQLPDTDADVFYSWLVTDLPSPHPADYDNRCS